MIKILLFAGIAEKIGQAQINFDEADITVKELIQHVSEKYPQIDIELRQAMIAVNEEFVEETTLLQANDVVAFIPPVSGG